MGFYFFVLRLIISRIYNRQIKPKPFFACFFVQINFAVFYKIENLKHIYFGSSQPV